MAGTCDDSDEKGFAYDLVNPKGALRSYRGLVTGQMIFITPNYSNIKHKRSYSDPNLSDVKIEKFQVSKVTLIAGRLFIRDKYGEVVMADEYRCGCNVIFDNYWDAHAHVERLKQYIRKEI